MTATCATVDSLNPWPGLPAYQEDDAPFFRGRSEDVAALLRLVASERVTVLYGASGLGKTSLLNAGLSPALRQEHVLPVSVRLIHGANDHPYDDQLLDALAQTCRQASVEYPAVDPERSTLWEYFHRRENDFWNRRNRPVVPLLIFDQFEEIFTLGRRSKGRVEAAEQLIA